jgi:hypothetical protein
LALKQKLHKTRYIYISFFKWQKKVCAYVVTQTFQFLLLQQVKHLRLFIFECKEPSSQAFKLGFAAATLLGLAHVIANLLGGCNCICSQEELEKASPSRQLSLACLFFTWYVIVKVLIK